MLPNQLVKLLLVYLSFFMLNPDAQAQTINVDSLLKAVNTSNSDSTNGQIYYDLARNFYSSDTKNALIWAGKGAEYFEKSKLTQLMTRCMNIEAVCLLILDRHEESINLHYEILKIREAKNDTLGMAETLLNIGNVYYKGHDMDEAVKFYLRSRAFAQKKNNIKLLASLNNNIGNYYADRYGENRLSSDKNAAIKHLKEAIVNKEKLNTDKTLEKSYLTLAKVLLESGDFKTGEYYTNKANKLALINKNDEAVGSSKILLGKIALEKKDYQTAQSHLDEMYQYAASKKALHILNTHDQDILNIRDRIRQLQFNIPTPTDSTHINNYNSLLVSRQKVREELNIKYETEKKELENANLALKNKIAQDNLKQIRIISTISTIFAIALLFLVFKLRKKNFALAKSEKEIRNQAKLVNKQNQLLKESEAFKTKLFSIISHDLKSPINSLKFIVQMSDEQQLSLKDYSFLMENLKKELHITSNLLENLLFWSKSQMKSNSIKLETFNLYNTIQKTQKVLASSIELKQIQIKNLLPSNYTILGDEMRCEFLVRNIMHNAIKYSDFYKQIEIGIKDKGEEIDFYIKDNGVGMSPEQVKKMFNHDGSRISSKGTMNELGAGIGMLLCHDFVESLGWTLQVESTLGLGTIFHIHIPKDLNNTSEHNKTAARLDSTLQIH